jgi:hypothetical protein
VQRLGNSKEIRTRRYDERTVDDTTVSAEDLSKETKPRGKRPKLWKKPPRIEIVLGDPISDDTFEILKGLIKKARLRRQRRLPGKQLLAVAVKRRKGEFTEWQAP